MISSSVKINFWDLSIPFILIMSILIIGILTVIFARKIGRTLHKVNQELWKQGWGKDVPSTGIFSIYDDSTTSIGIFVWITRISGLGLIIFASIGGFLLIEEIFQL